jgi:hypothetical protein
LPEESFHASLTACGLMCRRPDIYSVEIAALIC